jgi:SAM domain (Sterile alpha motif)
MNKGSTYDVPPSYPVFDMKSSTLGNKSKLATQVQVNQTPTTPTFIIQLPDQNRTNSHLELSPNSSKLPLIGEFLNHLDHKHNCDVYTKFGDAFLEEAITVNIIKDLTDEQLQKLGVVKIGWQKNIKQAAQKY